MRTVLSIDPLVSIVGLASARFGVRRTVRLVIAQYRLSKVLEDVTTEVVVDNECTVAFIVLAYSSVSVRVVRC